MEISPSKEAGGEQIPSGGNASDIEIVEKCAKAMGLQPYERGGFIQQCSSYGIYIVGELGGRGYTEYSPLTDDAQAMALMKKFRMDIQQFNDGECHALTAYADGFSNGYDLNRAICNCAASMDTASTPKPQVT